MLDKPYLKCPQPHGTPFLQQHSPQVIGVTLKAAVNSEQNKPADMGKELKQLYDFASSSGERRGIERAIVCLTGKSFVCLHEMLTEE